MKHFIESRFGLVLALSGLAGLCVPGLPVLPPQAVTILLGVVMFLACLRMEWGEFGQLPLGQLSLFWLARFAIVPILLYFAASILLPHYAAALMLLALLPPGTSSAAFAGLFGGSVPAALFLTLLSSLTAVVLIPGSFALLGEPGINPPVDRLLFALLECVLLPVILAYALRRRPRLGRLSDEYGKMLTILLLAIIFLSIIAGKRGAILADPAALVIPFSVAAGSYALFIAAALVCFRRSPPVRIALLTCSAYNNSALGMTLALLDFPSVVVLTIVLCQVCWVLLPVFTRPLISAIQRSTAL